MAKQGFYTDGMTVDQILALGDDVLRQMTQRDLSRAVRTVSLAANKRLDRLLDNAVKRKGEYVQKKSAKHTIALDALNKVYDEAGKSSKAMRFGAGGKTRNELYAELSRARGFMGLKSSTIKGAERVRKLREVRVMGKTREQYIKDEEKAFKEHYKALHGKAPTRKEVKEANIRSFKEFSSKSSDIWAAFRKWYETPGHKAILKGEGKDLKIRYYGSDEILDFIASRTAQGDSEEDVLKAAAEKYNELYKDEQDAETDEQDDYFDDDDSTDLGENF